MGKHNTWKEPKLYKAKDKWFVEYQFRIPEELRYRYKGAKWIVLEEKNTGSGLQFPSSQISKEVIDANFRRVQNDVKTLVENRLDQMRNTPSLAPLILNPKVGARRRKQSKL